MRVLAAIACVLTGCGLSHEIAERDASTTSDADLGDAGMDGGVEVGCLPRATEADILAFGEWVRRFYCETAAACDEGLAWPDVETCMRYDSLAWREPWGHSAALLREGSMVADEEGFADCLARHPSCAGGRTIHDRVGLWARTGAEHCSWLRPRCAGAGICRWDDCGPDQYCDYGSTECGENRCVPALPPGAECTWFEECAIAPGADAAVCMRASDGEPEQCFAARLLPPVGEGARCGPIAIDGHGVELAPCEVGLDCVARDPERPLVRECWRGPDVGETCEPVEGFRRRLLCRQGLFCRSEDGTTCVPPRTLDPVYVGEPCESDADREQCDWQRFSECVEGVCREAGREAGQPCDVHQQTASERYGASVLGATCPVDAFCDRSSTCRPQRPLGDACGSTQECQSLCCDAAACVQASEENGCYVDVRPCG